MSVSSRLPTCGVLAVLMLAMTGMASAQGQLAAKTDSALDVVLKNLDERKQDFESLVGDELGPRRTEIRDAMKVTMARLDEHLIALRRNPDDLGRKAAYEETLSLALTQAAGYLRDYGELEPKTLSRIDSLATATRDSMVACQREADASQQEVTEYKRQADAVERKLQELARQYQNSLTGDGELPDEIDLEVQLLGADLDVARRTATFAAMAEQDMKLTAEELALQLRDLQALRNTLSVSFRRASGQRMLLAKVADLKSRRLTAMQMRDRFASFGQMMPELAGDLGNVDSVIDRFLYEGGPDNSRRTAHERTDSGPRPGAEILKHYLNPDSQKETRDGNTSFTSSPVSDGDSDRTNVSPGMPRSE